LLERSALVLAVLGHIHDAGGDCVSRPPDHDRLAVHEHAARGGAGDSEHGLHDFRPTRADQSVDAEDLGDGSNFAGHTNLALAFEQYLQSAAEIYSALPNDWTLLIEHKMYEPAFYSTVIHDCGSSLIAAETLGPKALCLVDLGHHAPGVNIEMIIARLIHRGRLGGFHFNDSKYGDDDLDAGSIDPMRLFLIFNELVDAENTGRGVSRRAYAGQVAQRDRPDREPDRQCHRGDARLCSGFDR